ncbi:rRNA maturation RNase YbeY [Buchnera aphidicola]|nr:rRNA maturation RNase YbeY [Buchnera aphidicola]
MKIDIQNVCKKNIFFPKKKYFFLWLKNIFKNKKIEITIRIVDMLEMKFLNKKYKKKNSLTNVLSFQSPDSIKIKHRFLNYIGDIILCAPYINKEANILKKKKIELWAHMTIHSTLHLLHYSHKDSKSKKNMQKTEIYIMKKLGYNNPYN